MRALTSLRAALATISLLALLPACAFVPARTGIAPLEAESVVLPTEFWRDYFMVPVALGDDPERVLWFLFDTGANVTVIDPDALEAVSAWSGGAGESVRLVDASCGALTFRALPARTLELDHIERAVGRRMDGILGYPAFAELLVTLDYGAEELRVRSGALGRPDGETVFPLLRGGDARPWIEVTVGSVRRKVLVDSGAGGGLSLRLDDDAAWSVVPRAVAAGMGIDGVRMRRIGRMEPPARILGLEFAAPEVQATPSTELIGTKVLKHFALTFDQRNDRVAVVRASTGPVAPVPLRGTGLLTVPRPEGLVVLALTPGSPAERAGLRIGDRVLEVSGTPFDGRPNGVFEPLRDGDREFHRYRVLREGVESLVEVDLTDLVPVAAATPNGR